MSEPRETDVPDPVDADPALHAALRDLLAPLAQLALARGLPYAALQDMMKEAFVREAYDAHADLLPHRRVSRVSAATGINRREVARCVDAVVDAGAAGPASRVPARSLPAEVFAHWRADAHYQDAAGQPRSLPRLGPAPSFETLAQSVTRDVHPRTLLDELVRLGLAHWDAAADVVSLARDAFVPRGDQARMLGFLGANVGDHLQAAVSNVLADGSVHFEQAIFAHGLSDASLQEIRAQISEQWRRLSAELVPALERLIARDEAAALEPSAERRLRIGLYSFDDRGAETARTEPTPAKPRRARRRG